MHNADGRLVWRQTHRHQREKWENRIGGAMEPRRFSKIIEKCPYVDNFIYFDTTKKHRYENKENAQKKDFWSYVKLLKEKKYELLDTYDRQIAEKGLYIQNKRKKMIFKFNSIFTKIYEDVSNIDNVKIEYKPSWNEINDKTPDIDEIIALLQKKRHIDYMMETSVSGPHRDRIIFTRNKQKFIPTASTGQRRLISILLRVAQAVHFSEITGKKPVLLMDDVMLELDPEKREKVTISLPDYDQLFCTFLPGEPYERYKHSTTRIYFIKNGTWNEY